MKGVFSDEFTHIIQIYQCLSQSIKESLKVFKLTCFLYTKIDLTSVVLEANQKSMSNFLNIFLKNRLGYASMKTKEITL